jgi:hypothetical protein
VIFNFETLILQNPRLPAGRRDIRCGGFPYLNLMVSDMLFKIKYFWACDVK